MRIAVDIDGILTKETEGWDYANRTPRLVNVNQVNVLFEQGHTIILYTARFEVDRQVTVSWLHQHGIKYHDLIMDKLQYDLFIDDRALPDFYGPTSTEISNYKEEQAMKKLVLGWRDINTALDKLALKNERVYGVPKGGMIVVGLAKQKFPGIQIITDPWETKPDLILDDLIDSGATRKKYKTDFPDVSFESLFDKRDMDGNPWIVLPWEADHPAGADSIQQNIVRQLEYIGEDPNREGLLDTPKRIVKSWDELFAGYNQDPKELLRRFDAETYDQIVLLKDIELYSMCEHHMLPFTGIAHVAYIPDKRVIGISKLARLVDIYARRLQIQERIGEQVTSFLMNELNALGAACIIEASHMCMRMRGCSKQRSTMVTSSLKGMFFKKPEARQELMQLIKG
jgi:GTP cyclohydrolase I